MQYVPPPIIMHTTIPVAQKPEPEVFDPLMAPDEAVHRMAADIVSEIDDLERQDGEPVTVEQIGLGLNRVGYEARMRGLGRTLNDLRRAGYITRVRRGDIVGYRMTPKGHAWAAE